MICEHVNIYDGKKVIYNDASEPHGTVVYAYKEDGKTWLLVDDEYEIAESDIISKTDTTLTVKRSH